MESAFSGWTLAVMAACLGAWLVRGALVFWRLAQRWAASRGAAGRLRQMRAGVPREGEAWLCFAGLLLGSAAGLYLARPAAPERLQPVLLAICLGLEELRTPRGLDALPSVIALLHACRSNRERPLLETFADVPEQLPPGAVREALLAALRKFRQGQDTPACMQALAGLHPLLDEFVADAAYAGWRAGPALNVVLEPLLRQAQGEWERTVKQRRFFEKAGAWLVLGRYAAPGALAAVFCQAAAGAPIAFELPAHQLALGAALVLASSLVLYAALARPLLRRGLLAAAILWVGLWWAAPVEAPAQALEPTVTPARRVSPTLPSRAAPATATCTPTAPPLPTATPPHRPVQFSATPGQHLPAASPTAPPVPTATPPAVAVPPTPPPAPQEPAQPTAPAVPAGDPTPPPPPGG
ncbi:MAG: hypothetical protein ACOYYS_17750 [Chloroflexota bacterium]